MARLLGLLLLIGLAWLIVKRALGPARVRTRRPPPPRFEKTVRCTRCGVHLPLSLARDDNDGYVCDDARCSGRREHGRS